MTTQPPKGPTQTSVGSGIVKLGLLQYANTPSIKLQGVLSSRTQSQPVTILIDSGATGNLIQEAYANKWFHKTLKTLKKAFPIMGFQDTSAYRCESYVELKLTISSIDGRKHNETNRFYLAPIDNFEIILGTDWLKEHNPSINWATNRLYMTRCPIKCATNPGVILDGASRQQGKQL